MTKHTPAPWGFFRADIGFDDEAWVVDQTSERELDEDGDIHLYFQIARVCEEEDDDGVAEANARLMAAAPEMLAALENLENDDGAIPASAWNLVVDAVGKAGGMHKDRAPFGLGRDCAGASLGEADLRRILAMLEEHGKERGFWPSEDKSVSRLRAILNETADEA
jgi:hypothetical protein